MTREEGLQRLAYYWQSYRKKFNEAFAQQRGADAAGYASAASSMARQFKELAGLDTTDQAVAEIRKINRD